MSAPTPPSRLPQHPAHHRPAGPREPWPAPRPAGRARAYVHPSLRRRRTAFDIVARIGTAVTLAAVLVVITTALAMVDATPTPAGVTTSDRR